MKLATALLLVCAAIGCSQDPHVTRQKHLARGDEYEAAGKLPEAILEFRNAVQADPKAGDARVRLAEAYVRAGDGGKALGEYVRAADLLPDDAAVQVKTGTLELLSQQFGPARERAERILERDAANVDAQILLANALAGLKEFDAAVAEIEQAIQLNPSRGSSYSSLGAFEVGRGNSDAAERAFQKAVELDVNSVAARLALANYYWVNARWTEAERELLKAAEVDTKNVATQRALANFYIATNRAAEAEQHLRQVHNLTGEPAAAFALADFYAARKDDGAARTILETLAGKRLTAALAEIKLAALEYRAGQSAAADQRLDKVLGQDKTNLPALLTRAEARLTEGRLEEALGLASLAADSHQDSAAAHFTVGRIQAARRQNDAAIAAFNNVLRLNPRATDAKLALARAHLAAGHPDTSVTIAQQIVDAQPETVEARLTAVRGLLARKDLARAEVELGILLKSLPEFAPVHSLLGVLAGLHSNELKARQHFERALKLEPNSVEALRGLVGLDVAARRPADARARVDQRLAAAPKNSAVLMLAAQTYASTGDLQTAETLLRRLLAIDDTYLDAYSALAHLYVKQGRLEAALIEFDQLAKRQPRPVAPLTLAGVILQGQGKTGDARDRFIRALELDPDAAVAANNLAWLYAESGEHLDRALELALGAKARAPNSAAVDDTVGWVHYKRGAAADAIPYFQKSVEADPNNATYHYHLGAALASVGNVYQARQSLDRAIALKPGYEEAISSRHSLTDLPDSRP